MADLKAFAEQLVNLSVKEVNELAQILKDEYGIEPAAAAVAVAGPAAAGAAPADQHRLIVVFVTVRGEQRQGRAAAGGFLAGGLRGRV